MLGDKGDDLLIVVVDKIGVEVEDGVEVVKVEVVVEVVVEVLVEVEVRVEVEVIVVVVEEAVDVVDDVILVVEEEEVEGGVDDIDVLAWKKVNYQ